MFQHKLIEDREFDDRMSMMKDEDEIDNH
jgi:hypothetical protein